MNPFQKKCCAVLAVLALVPASGWASHPEVFRPAWDGFLQGNPLPAEKAFRPDASEGHRNGLLYLYELGTLYQMKGDLVASQGLFQSADALAHKYEQAAVVSVSGVARQVGAALTNDTVLTYEGHGYEKVMARTLQAMNYLLRAQPGEALVEVRKAEEYQTLERASHDRELAKAKEKSPRNANVASASLDNAQIRKQYGPMFAYVQGVRNSFENAFTYYLSSQIYAMQGAEGLNDALVDIRKAFELDSQSPAIRAAYLELLARAGTPGDGEEAERQLGLKPEPSLEQGTGTVIVLYETGRVPRLEEARITLNSPSGWVGVAYPIYREFGEKQAALQVTCACGTTPTSRVLDLRPLAVKALQEALPGILVRGLVGAIAKAEAQKQANNGLGVVAGLAARATAAAVTAADLRSWLSLPAEIHAVRLALPPGAQQVTLTAPEWSETRTFNVAAGSTTFLVARAMGPFRTLQSVTFPASKN